MNTANDWNKAKVEAEEILAEIRRRKYSRPVLVAEQRPVPVYVEGTFVYEPYVDLYPHQFDWDLIKQTFIKQEQDEAYKRAKKALGE